MRLLKRTFLLTLMVTLSCSCNGNKKITMESLLDEMVSVEELSRFPDPYYTCLQESSHDRRSVAPDQLVWRG